ncbi:ribonuclease HII [Roseicyclus persicicus]|uniref:Ribonuclease HII n=1 Tax=Roseicyclus persicicus TaxID=2650661 RepID=A0A7X6GXS1_9RHOB|nr:ribonuclease HII [Roseibacterium persicicum]NKX43256.1 ribonuclease HII [Roseibacterium persicicum]
MPRSQPELTHEIALGGRVAGVDEAGRGPLAGPVAAAAVVLDPARLPPGLNDSKALTARRRAALFDLIHETAEVSLAWASVEEIDRLNIRAASLLAMRRAVEGLARVPDAALIDGNACPEGLPCRGVTLVKGDALSLSVAAASIVAKVARDRVMAELARAFPGYGWEVNQGYPTAEHRAALQDMGVTPHHRRSFRPVHNILLSGAAQHIDSKK